MRSTVTIERERRFMRRGPAAIEANFACSSYPLQRRTDAHIGTASTKVKRRGPVRRPGVDERARRSGRDQNVPIGFLFCARTMPASEGPPSSCFMRLSMLKFAPM